MTSSCSRAVSEGSRFDCWKTMPMRSRRSAVASPRLSVAASIPPMRTLPESGWMRVAATASSEDFPEPEGPVIPVTRPAGTLSDT